VILGNTKLKVSFMMEEMRKVGDPRRSNKGTLQTGFGSLSKDNRGLMLERK